MKVLLVTSAYPLRQLNVVGGVEGVCYYLTQAFLKIPDIEIEVLVPSGKVESSCTTIIGGVKVHIIPVDPKIPKYINILWAVPQAILRKIDQLEADIIHVQNEAAWAAKLKRPNVLLTIHGINERDTLFRGSKYTQGLRHWINSFVNIRARRKLKNIIAINPYVHKFLNQGTRQIVSDIENPVADTFFQIPRSPEPGRVLCSASIIERKNIIGLIDGFSKFLNGSGEGSLRIAGTGVNSPYGESCQTLIRQLNIEKYVKFLGLLSIEDVHEELHQATCLALCSFQETASLAISEAMAAGLPVLASNICGNPWLVNEGKTGRLINPYDTNDIARGMRQLLMQDSLVDMSVEAKNQAEKRFRASVVAAKTLEVYSRILDDAKNG